MAHTVLSKVLGPGSLFPVGNNLNHWESENWQKYKDLQIVDTTRNAYRINQHENQQNGMDQEFRLQHATVYRSILARTGT
eukprot:16007674-Heterocapsa_arctica.AAC.1